MVDARFALAMELFEAGEDMMRQTLRRRFPHEGADAIERRLDAWLSERPGAEDGDAVGRPVGRDVRAAVVDDPKRRP